jgi:hypothetical protein
MVVPDIWVAKDDGTDIVRAQAIVAVGRDYNGNITARLAGHDGADVTLVAHEALPPCRDRRSPVLAALPAGTLTRPGGNTAVTH